MRRTRSIALAATVLVVAACSEPPTAPPTTKIAPQQADPSIITPLLLPPGAAWGLYFTSFNRDRNLTMDAIHYYNGNSSGRGSFVVPGVAAGILHVARVVAQTDQGCIP